MEYYSLEEIGDMLLESLATVVLASSEAGEPVVDEATYRNQLTGETGEGDPLTADVNVYLSLIHISSCGALIRAGRWRISWLRPGSWQTGA